MFFLVRTAFWLTLVLMLIPLFGSGPDGESRDPIDPVAAYFAAQAAVSDVTGFCDRNPAACETGGEALAALGAQARDGARIVYQFLDQKVGETDGQALPKPELPLAETDPFLVTGSTQAAPGTLALDPLPMPGQAYDQIVSQPETPVGPVPRSKPRSG
ncbi:hypothetical protein GCM10011316_23520 [Roseibium aquae]|uniref:DUF5330 domain-containing protein n=1 Tax=Roseibium aquae TaxID=1323746 RepID=A0A916X2A1_9HYPH|nr:DUF5330 domain-containing protein [Roseibium aquae]GGB50682.1 hypothetical protein GCM10011316_23520 [Roseibium aquae]